MKYSEATLGRVFILRLENEEIVHKEIEQFATKMNIRSATLTIVGGADKNSELIVGPKKRNASPVTPMSLKLDDAHEVFGTGTIFPDDTGVPLLHMHMGCGRENNSIVGCIRKGVVTWHVLEVVIIELNNSSAKRLPDPITGFKLLIP